MLRMQEKCPNITTQGAMFSPSCMLCTLCAFQVYQLEINVLF